jgi:hypothetical protein
VCIQHRASLQCSLIVVNLTLPNVSSDLFDPLLPSFEQNVSNPLWKKNRNSYARLLLQQLIAGRLEEPFDALPCAGPLPTLHKYLASQHDATPLSLSLASSSSPSPSSPHSKHRARACHPPQPSSSGPRQQNERHNHAREAITPSQELDSYIWSHHGAVSPLPFDGYVEVGETGESIGERVAPAWEYTELIEGANPRSVQRASAAPAASSGDAANVKRKSNDLRLGGAMEGEDLDMAQRVLEAEKALRRQGELLSRLLQSDREPALPSSSLLSYPARGDHSLVHQGQRQRRPLSHQPTEELNDDNGDGDDDDDDDAAHQYHNQRDMHRSGTYSSRKVQAILSEAAAMQTTSGMPSFLEGNVLNLPSHEHRPSFSSADYDATSAANPDVVELQNIVQRFQRQTYELQRRCLALTQAKQPGDGDRTAEDRNYKESNLVSSLQLDRDVSFAPTNDYIPQLVKGQSNATPTDAKSCMQHHPVAPNKRVGLPVRHTLKSSAAALAQCARHREDRESIMSIRQSMALRDENGARQQQYRLLSSGNGYFSPLVGESTAMLLAEVTALRTRLAANVESMEGRGQVGMVEF